MDKLNSQKPHVAIYGRCNVGKSSLMNILIGTDASIVSDMAGTTTDVVKRNIEISGVGGVVVYDTAGFDDSSLLGELRVKSTLNTLMLIDLAIVVVSDGGIVADSEVEFIKKIETLSVPYIVVVNNFSDSGEGFNFINPNSNDRNELFELIKKSLPRDSYIRESMFDGIVKSGDKVLLVCPIDSEAPVGRLVPVQTQAIRELLDLHAVVAIVQTSEVSGVVENGEFDLVVADSSVVDIVEKLVGGSAKITTFSIILAQLKGDMKQYREGLAKIDNLRNGDRILILESCVHQTSCDDIGRVKLPRWLESYCGCNFIFDIVTAVEPLPDDLSVYALALQCGGCMVTRRQLQQRLRALKMGGVAVTNYGMAIKKIK